MCGPSSAIGLDAAERAAWPYLRERLRPPGQLMALMRGVLGGDTEVAVVAAVTGAGVAEPLALLVTPAIAAELTMVAPLAGEPDTWAARIGDDPVTVLTRARGGEPEPVAIRMTPWIRQHLTPYARQMWTRRRPERR